MLNEFSDNVYKLIYGNINIEQLKNIKTKKEIWNDIILYLGNDDITKIDYIKKMKALEVLDILNSKLKTKKISKIKPIMNPIGFKNK